MADTFTLDFKSDASTSSYKVKSKDIMDILTRDFRSQGYNIITFGETLRELEKGNHKVVIVKENDNGRLHHNETIRSFA